VPPRFAPTMTAICNNTTVALAEVSVNVTKRNHDNGSVRSSGDQFDEHDSSGDGDGQAENDEQPTYVPDGHSYAVSFCERPVAEFPRQPFLLQVVHNSVGEQWHHSAQETITVKTIYIYIYIYTDNNSYYLMINCSLLYSYTNSCII